MSIRDARWFAEDMVKLGRWLVRESRDELHSRFWKAVEGVDSRLAPKHVQQGWDGFLAEEEASREVWEPGEASLLSWGVDGATTQPQCQAGHREFSLFHCTKPFGHDGEHGYAGCFWPESEAVDPDSVAASATDRPAGVEPTSPEAPPAGHPPMPPYREVFVPEADRIPTSELLSEAADYINATFPLRDTKYVDDLTATLYRRADAFRAVENIP